MKRKGYQLLTSYIVCVIALCFCIKVQVQASNSGGASVRFEKTSHVKYTLFVSVVGNGKIYDGTMAIVSGTNTYLLEEGNKKTFRLAPAKGYYIEKVRCAGVKYSYNKSTKMLSVEMKNQNGSVKVTYKKEAKKPDDPKKPDKKPDKDPHKPDREPNTSSQPSSETTTEEDSKVVSRIVVDKTTRDDKITEEDIRNALGDIGDYEIISYSYDERTKICTVTIRMADGTQRTMKVKIPNDERNTKEVDKEPCYIYFLMGLLAIVVGALLAYIGRKTEEAEDVEYSLKKSNWILIIYTIVATLLYIFGHCIIDLIVYLSAEVLIITIFWRNYRKYKKCWKNLKVSKTL